MNLRFLHIMIFLFSLSLGSDLIVNLIDKPGKLCVADMDCDENDPEDTEENDSGYQDYIFQISFNAIASGKDIQYDIRYLFPESRLKASPELPPPDVA